VRQNTSGSKCIFVGFGLHCMAPYCTIWPLQVDEAYDLMWRCGWW
jgi:hypothetical protein